jgi:hypothetical protein
MGDKSVSVKKTISDPRLISIVCAAFGQLVMMGAMAVVSRHYLPLALSQYGIFYAVFGIMQIIASMRIEQSIVYEGDQQKLCDTYSAAVTLTLPVIAFASIIAEIYLYSNPDTREMATLMAFSLFFAALLGGISRVVVQLIARADSFYILAFTNFVRPTLIALSQLAGIMIGSKGGVASLCIAFAASQLILIGSIAWISRGILEKTIYRLDIKRTIDTIRRHKSFVLYSLPQNLIYLLSESLYPLSLSFIFPHAHAVAFFWLASRAVFAPATILAESLRAMIYRRIGKYPNTIARTVFSTSLILGGIVLIGPIILAITGERLFEFVFGPGWGPANSFGIILGILVTFNMASLPLVGSLPIMNLQRGLLFAEVGGAMIRGLELFLVNWQSPQAALLWTTFSYIGIMSCFFGWVIFKIIQRQKSSTPIFGTTA